MRCWASRMKGELHPLLRTAFEADFSAKGGGRRGDDGRKTERNLRRVFDAAARYY